MKCPRCEKELEFVDTKSNKGVQVVNFDCCTKDCDIISVSVYKKASRNRWTYETKTH